MPTHKSSDYKLSAVKYYLSHSKNQVQTCKIFGCYCRTRVWFISLEWGRAGRTSESVGPGGVVRETA